MNTAVFPRFIFYASLLLVVLLAISSIAGFFYPAYLYARETNYWLIQCEGQDAINLVFLLPSLLITTILVYQGSRRFLPLWAGAVAYTLYTFIIYSFSVHFNALFFIYCIMLGVSFRLLFWYTLYITRQSVADWFKNKPVVRFLGYYFILLGTAFYGLWIMQLLPAILGRTVPAVVLDSGLPTNPVHVLDISVCLPFIILTGIRLLQRKSWALLCTPAVLLFLTLMSLTIAGLILFMQYKGQPGQWPVVIVMASLAVFNLWQLNGYLRSMQH
ncbi:MAG: hypothetical protein QM781_03680 [Chitinophagaceae bacterium]